MRLFPFGRALFGTLPLVLLVAALAGCSREPDPKAPAAASRPAATSDPQDPNAENPDRDSWVDLATKPFEPKLVGGTFVLIRGLNAQSLNAVARVNNSPDVEKLHKFLLGAPLLMEIPDRGPQGFQIGLNAAAKMPEDSPDHLSQVWTLRPDLTWEDGKPVTAKDYAFTFGLFRNPEVNSTIQKSYDEVASIEELDTFRFRVTWKSVQRSAIQKIGHFQVVPAHAVPHDAASFNKVATHLACGPYRIVSFEPGKRLELALRDEYRAKSFPIRPHYVERYVFDMGPTDQTATMARLKNGDAHLIGLSPDQYVTVPSDAAFNAAAWRTSFVLQFYSYIAWNLKDPKDVSRPHPILGDLRVRQALAHLLQLETIAATTFHNLLRPVSGPYDYRDPGYDPALPPVPFDPKKAAALLREAGWTPGPDGRLAKDGRPLRLTLFRVPRGPLIVVPAAFQEEARKIGVTIDIAEPDKGFYDVLAAHQFDAGLIQWQLDPVEPDVSEQWHSRYASKDGANYSGLADPEVDRLLDAHEITFDAAARAAIRRDVHRRVRDGAPAAFVFSAASTVGLSRSFANVKVHDLGIWYRDIVLRDLWEKHRPR